MNSINELRFNTLAGNKTDDTQDRGVGDEFAKMLKSEIEGLNTAQEKGEAAMTDIATGQMRDLHQTAIAITKAEDSMKFMLGVRNKVISAYKEITRIQI